MHRPPLPLTRDLVLIGGGHTHALVLRKWGMNALPGARVTLINPGPTAPYSGMLPGFLAGHYARSDLDIDLVKLARFAGARVIFGAVDSIDSTDRKIYVAGRPPVGFDVASINVGITSDMPSMPGFSEHGVPAKPLGPFAARWAAYLAGQGPASIVVIGGGVAGVEVSMAMAHAMKTRGRTARITLIDNAVMLSSTHPKAAATIRNSLAGLGVDVIEQMSVDRITESHVHLKDGRNIPADFVTGAAGARPYDWIAQTGLELQDGFIQVNAYLQSSDADVFAAGDCAHLSTNPRPKAGVFAVREAPILFHNLRAALGAGSLRSFVPQRDYLKLISLGRKSALAERLGTSLNGPLMWELKNRIDQSFMNKFRNLPQMQQQPLPKAHAAGLEDALGDKPMCGGCGAKIAHSALQSALIATPVSDRADITPLPGDDAALLTTGAVQQVITSDHLRAFTEDPVLMTRIAAVHALGDIWAMGAKPKAATAMLILPRMSTELQYRTMLEIMTTATEELRAAGAEIVGGHSSMGDNLTIGFTITGLCARAPIILAGGRPGDMLILTKPLGSGTILAAEMAGQAQGDVVAGAFQLMTQSQQLAADILAQAHAMTDVTGFGLAGHLSGICQSSNCGAVLDMAAIPLMDGALELSASGIRSTLFPDNRSIAPELPYQGKAALLFDPQTAGGLLAAVAAPSADALLVDLKNAGYSAAIIGQLTENPGLRLQT
ncbi:MAG: selenide, water dikinase SelD [Pseudomonadota bacterium]